MNARASWWIRRAPYLSQPRLPGTQKRARSRRRLNLLEPVSGRFEWEVSIVGGARSVDLRCVPFAFAKFVQGCFAHDANLRYRAIEKLAEKVAARQAELEAELQRLSQFGGKPAKKAQAAPQSQTARAKKREKNGEAEQQSEPEAGQNSEAA